MEGHLTGVPERMESEIKTLVAVKFRSEQLLRSRLFRMNAYSSGLYSTKLNCNNVIRDSLLLCFFLNWIVNEMDWSSCLSKEILDSNVLSSFVTDANNCIFYSFTLVRFVFCIIFAILNEMSIK